MEHETALEHDDAKVFGFWIYLMTDIVIFTVLFASYLVLKENTFGGPGARELYEMPTVVAETMALLISNFTCSLATYAIERKQKNLAIVWFFLTFILGAIFLGLEIHEFYTFASDGNSWQRSAFLSSFFALVGTHGLHITVGLMWIIVTILCLLFRGIIASDFSRIVRLGYFWHFLDIVWIFIFTVVYGMGHLS